jgi:hypothetical protein
MINNHNVILLVIIFRVTTKIITTITQNVSLLKLFQLILQQ